MPEQNVITERVSTALQEIHPDRIIWIAYSGGLDSIVLLHATKTTARLTGHSIQAIHVNHQLHKDSQDWAQHCQSQCKILAVPLVVVTVDISPYKHLGAEGAARQVRYQAFEEHAGEKDVVLTAHHADDQIETVLLQLLRGTGVHGLVGCAAQRNLGHITLLRPLLEISRASLEQYAVEHQLQWVEDPSNHCIDYDRNYLRHKVLPLLHTRWQGLHATIVRSSQWQAESAQLLDKLAKADLNVNGQVGNPMPIEAFTRLDKASMKNALRWWIREHNFSMPNAQVIKHIIAGVLMSADDSEACVKWQECEVRKYRKKIYVHKSCRDHQANECYQWQLDQPLEIPSLGLTLTRKALLEFGLQLHDIQSLQVRFRTGGEVMRPRGRGCQKDLKALFQESGVEPWLRNRIPLLYDKETLVFVWGRWIHEGY